MQGWATVLIREVGLVPVSLPAINPSTMLLVRSKMLQMEEAGIALTQKRKRLYYRIYWDQDYNFADFVCLLGEITV